MQNEPEALIESPLDSLEREQPGQVNELVRHRALNYGRDFPVRRDADGNRLCRWTPCQKILTGKRQSFCSPACTEEVLIRIWPSHASRAVFERDRGVCARCGIDTEAFRRRVGSYMRHLKGECFKAMDMKPFEAFLALLDRKGWGYHTSRKFYEAHHKHAVIEGGGACGLDGFETLCLRCHKRETKDLAARRAHERRAAKTKQRRLEALGA